MSRRLIEGALRSQLSLVFDFVAPDEAIA